MTPFAKQLTHWYSETKRDLPWRKTRDAYPVWLSEIILQQTRVDQGLPYWENFMEEFPTVHDLASAPEDQVMRTWQGLGYYSRARNLHATAKYVSETLEGKFPTTRKGLLGLKGVGPYTASAIASICFDEATPVVDGNVFRFASRYFGIKEDIMSTKARLIFETRLLDEIDEQHPGNFNQAMMEFGATVCMPQPKCDSCVFNMDCFARKYSIQKDLPVKTKKGKVTTRYFNYVVFKFEDKFLMKQRSSGDVWQGLYDFHLEEGGLDEQSLVKRLNENFNFKKVITINNSTDQFKHILSHQKIFARFFEVSLKKEDYRSVIQKAQLSLYSTVELLNLPKPKLIVNYLAQLGIK